MPDFVCPWCAETFPTRGALGEHWMATPDCNRNRNVSNPLQSKYGMAQGIENIPGEGMLTKVRSEGCEHPENLREPLRESMEADAQIIGFRCGYCYTEFAID